MHLRENRRWVPPSFENHNKKRYRAHKFYFTISSADHICMEKARYKFSIIIINYYYRLFSCVAEARFCLFPGRKILVLPHQFGQHIVE